MPRVRSCLLLCAFAVLFPDAPLVGQSSRAYLADHRYTEAIRSIPWSGSRDAAELADEQMSVLGLAYLRRGLLFYDLAQLQVTLGTRYYALRDTASNAARSPQTPFFRGRYQFEAGDVRSALQSFQRAARAQGASDLLRERARMWAGASLASLGRRAEATQLWNSIDVSGRPALAAEKTYAAWRSGTLDGTEVRPGGRPGRSVGEQRLRLWSAAVTGQVETLPALADALVDAIEPDDVDAVARNVEIAFYDPSTWRILSRADLRTALHVFERLAEQTADQQLRRQARLLAARSALELYYGERAERNLSGIRGGDATLLRGAALAIQGDLDGADRHWASLASPENLDWIDLVTRIPGRESEAFAAFRALRGQRLDTGAAVLLARSLLRAGAVQEAQQVLRLSNGSVRTPTASNDPSFLANLARAEMASGRRYQADVLGYLFELQERFAAARPAYEMAQSVLALDAGEGSLMMRN